MGWGGTPGAETDTLTQRRAPRANRCVKHTPAPAGAPKLERLADVYTTRERERGGRERERERGWGGERERGGESP